MQKHVRQVTKYEKGKGKPKYQTRREASEKSAARFVDCGEDIVYDTETRLIWYKKDTYQITGKWMNWIQCRDFIEEQNINQVDFIKSDIEGGELNMLCGAEKLLERFRPDLMIEIVDVHCHRFGYSPIDVYQFLLSKGYNGLFIGNQFTKEKTNLKRRNGYYKKSPNN